MTDFLIIGRGLAATVLMHELHHRGLGFHVIGNPALSSCSRVAAGIWHPVVFNRMTLSWRAGDFIPYMLQFYRMCESRLGEKLVTERQLIRNLASEAEEQLWVRKAGEELNGFIGPEIHRDVTRFPKLRISRSYGLVNFAGNLDVKLFIDSTGRYFAPQITSETFRYRDLQVLSDSYMYQGVKAQNIVFCEGHLVRSNPFFSWVPMRPAKGEVILVRMDQTVFRDGIFNKNGFLMDTGLNTFKIGATYEWDNLDDQPTKAKLSDLQLKTEALTPCPFEIIEHEAGVRPSSFDRRPIIGEHPRFKGMHIFNGLGTKGVMLAPWFATKFVNFCQKQEPLDPDADVGRFSHLYDAAQKA